MARNIGRGTIQKFHFIRRFVSYLKPNHIIRLHGYPTRITFKSTPHDKGCHILRNLSGKCKLKMILFFMEKTHIYTYIFY